jgi:hypothetical protein
MGQVQDGTPVYAAAGGTADVLTLALSPTPSAYAAGQEFRLKATATNTGAVTLNVNSLGAKDVKRDGSSALVAGDIRNGQMYTVRYDGTNFQLLAPSTFVTQSLTDSSTLPATTAFVQTLTATDARSGIIELATDAEYVTGTDAARAVTPAVARANNIVAVASVSASGTSVDFTGIPAWAKRITVMVSGISTNGTSVKQVRLGDSGGFESTNYLSASCFSNNATGTVSVANYTDGFALTGVNASDVQHGTIILTKHTGNTWICSGNIGFSSGGAFGTVAGTKATSATLDRIQLTTQGGTDTFDAGTVSITYE